MKGPPASRKAPAADALHVESLEEAVTHTLEEARMLLPGMQALFGFQLIAVFSARFDTALSEPQQYLHLAALLLSGMSIALAMAPAAYHRQTERGQVSAHFLSVASWLISAALPPLALGLCMDIFLVAHTITGHSGWSLALAALMGAVLSGLWFVFPLCQRLRAGRRLANHREAPRQAAGPGREESRRL